MEFVSNRFAWIVIAIGTLVSILATGNVDMTSAQNAASVSVIEHFSDQ